MSGNEQLDIAIQKLNENATAVDFFKIIQYLKLFLWIPLVVFFILTIINFIKYKKYKINKNKKLAIIFLILTIITILFYLFTPYYPTLIPTSDAGNIF